MKIKVLIALLLVSFASAAYTMESKEQELKFGTEISHITYKEPDFGVSEKGMFFGVYANYVYRPEWFVNYLSLDGHAAIGVVDYKGSGEIDNIDDYLMEPRVLVGKSLDLADNSRLTPYLGFGYRYLYDDLGGMVSSTGAAGYDRRSQYIYLPLGLTFDYVVNSEWVA